MLVIAVVLLKMMGPQEQTFRPCHLGVPGHERFSACLSRALSLQVESL